MIELQNITNEPDQIHFITLFDDDIEFRLRFVESQERWTVSIKYKDSSVLNLRAVLGTRLLSVYNFPFDIVILDKSGTELDPYKLNDFERLSIYILDSDDMNEIRGYDVDI